MEVTLSGAREAAIVRGYGSTGYVQTYVDKLADHLILKQKSDDLATKIEAVVGTSEPEISAEYLKAKAKIKAKLIADGEVTAVVQVEPK